MAKIMPRIILFLEACNLLVSIHGKKLVPCYYIFGDSLVDNGNNNGRNTTAKANYHPYGIDFPGGPTGKFTNGRNLADFIAEDLGFTTYIPPFATTKGAALMSGVNYASGGSGIFRTIGRHLGNVISFDKQLHHHRITVNRTISALGKSAMDHLGRCMYTVGFGSNDYFAYASIKLKPTPEKYDLYKSGARKVPVFGLGTISCVPIALHGRDYGPECLSLTRATTGDFNAKIKSLIDVINKELVGAKFTYIDIYEIAVSDPITNGFPFHNAPCCQVAAGGVQCAPNGPTCNSRKRYAYFDGVHPTEEAVKTIAKRAFKAKSRNDTHPFDIKRLALM